ncbi:hypothetical protein [Legionella jordanis]|uniref:Uncharacterized protein n=1 Tax=Legionella jordanis TaxID=456 RepID=A0A0W0VEX6_9GAMM|nr:hypothetical protein [Legionella jordanis]KTD18642.1 hypothetical protein Ljor_0306 [Legionella jordanis]RMX00848.1 hypothetical protein EAW55_11755 [Legionella jordanis]VEH11518.1 Uncharacterised protein [Legionella jordanis]
MDDLIRNYVLCLENFGKHHNSRDLCELSLNLAAVLRQKHTVLELLQSITQAVEEAQRFIGVEPLIKQLKQWEIHLETLAQLEASAGNVLLTLQFVGKTFALKSVMEEILKTPNYTLHNNGLSFLKYLHSNSLQPLLNYLDQLPAVTRSTVTQVGSFQHNSSLGFAYSQCVDLLNSNSKAFNERNEQQVFANNLLQTVLLIYRDLHRQTQNTIELSVSSCVLS